MSPRSFRPFVAARGALAALAAAAALGVLAGDADAVPDAYPLVLDVDDEVALCQTGTLLCPAAGTRCDDAKVVAVAADARGPVLRGVAPGTTLCSAATASGQGARRVYRVTVRPRRDR